ncbi:ABC transporter permease [Streptomyces sp. NPDC057433]|uniref:ABC transporter permease n=1 Tax=Streptomyces sp. NPDC057433 TaxID=3346132 RepID=UPI0036C2D60E
MGDGALVRVAAVVRQDLRLTLRDPTPFVVRTIMPLLIMAFMQPLFRSHLRDGGLADANGAEQAVPGMAVMSLFFLVNVIGFAMFREHGWNTWDRLRATAARPAELLVARMVLPMVTAVLQFAVVFVLGALLLHLHVTGSYLALAVVGVALALDVVMVGMALVAVCRTIAQVSVLSNVLALLFAGLGGALTPLSTLPGWARPLAPAVPSYWAMRGFSEIILRGGGLASVLLPTAMLCLFAVGLAVVILVFFRADHRKLSWS